MNLCQNMDKSLKYCASNVNFPSTWFLLNPLTLWYKNLKMEITAIKIQSVSNKFLK